MNPGDEEMKAPQEREHPKERKYPFPTFPPERGVKRRVLEYFIENPGWHTTKGFASDSFNAAGWESSVPWTKAIAMRLLRYQSQGLLERRRTAGKHEYEYSVTPRGEERWIYLANAEGLLYPTQTKSSADKLAAERRKSMASGILERHIEMTKIQLERARIRRILEEMMN